MFQNQVNISQCHSTHGFYRAFTGVLHIKVETNKIPNAYADCVLSVISTRERDGDLIGARTRQDTPRTRG